MVVRQINTFIPDCSTVHTRTLEEFVDIALKRTFYCFSAIKTKYYRVDGKTIYNHLNSDHYCTFLYFLSNTIFSELNEENIAAKIFLLNKSLYGLDLFYKVKMPDVFLLVHPLGTVIGNAVYKNYTVFYQNVAIGSTAEGIYPQFGEKTLFYSKTSVLGATTSGENVIFGANSFVINSDIPGNSTVVGQHPKNTIIKNDGRIINDIFEIE